MGLTLATTIGSFESPDCVITRCVPPTIALLFGVAIGLLIAALERKENCSPMFYLSTPPVLYDKIPKFLSHYGLNRQEGSYRRLVIEKPFGTDLASAKALNKSLKQYFNEEDIYRIDHYLGKETVQNLLVTRFFFFVYDVRSLFQKVRFI